MSGIFSSAAPRRRISITYAANASKFLFLTFFHIILTHLSFRMTYAPGSSNTTLRVHLDRDHREEYIRVCKQNNWEIKIASARQSQLEIASPLDAQRTPFSKSAFIQHLVMFIAANDQVR